MHSRLPQNFEGNRFSRIALEQKKHAIDLTKTNPTEVGLEYPVEALRGIFESAEIFPYDPDPRGLLSARTSIAQCRSRSGRSLDPSNLWLTSGTSEGYSFLIKLLTEPGDEVLIPSPSYPLFSGLLHVEGVRAVSYPLHSAGGWFIDFLELEKAITPKTKAIVLVNPNNPTGHFVQATERAKLNDLAAKHSLSLIVDEVFWGFPLEEGVERTSFAKDDAPVLTFVLDGLSKWTGLPQLKLSWVSAHGPKEAISSMAKRLDWISDLYLSVGTPVQRACPNLLEMAPLLASTIQERIEGNHRWLKQQPLRYVLNEGGWSAIIQLSDMRNEEEVAIQLAQKESVLVYPGYFFDLPFHSALVISLLPDPNSFRKGIDGICRVIEGGR